MSNQGYTLSEKKRLQDMENRIQRESAIREDERRKAAKECLKDHEGCQIFTEESVLKAEQAWNEVMDKKVEKSKQDEREKTIRELLNWMDDNSDNNDLVYTRHHLQSLLPPTK